MSKKRKYSEEEHPDRRRGDVESISEFAPELSKNTKFKLSLETMWIIGVGIVLVTVFYITNKTTQNELIKTQADDRAYVEKQLGLIREELKPTPKELNAELSAQKKVLEETREEVKGVKKAIEETSKEQTEAIRDLSDRLTSFMARTSRSGSR